MHELSIAESLIDLACEAADREQAPRVIRLQVRIGAIAGVVKEALIFSFELAAEGTACAGAELEIDDVPLTVHCPQCERTQTLHDTWNLSCPECGTPTPAVLTGRELELAAVEVDSNVPAYR